MVYEDCEYAAMSLEDLEYTLPITVERYEKRVMPCSDCKRDCNEYVRYEQCIYRNDDYFKGHKIRVYEITFVKQYSKDVLLLRTDYKHSFREALIEAHKLLDRMGLKPSEEKEQRSVSNDL